MVKIFLLNDQGKTDRYMDVSYWSLVKAYFLAWLFFCGVLFLIGLFWGLFISV